MQSRSYDAEVPWRYLLLTFTTLALAFVVLPACVENSGTGVCPDGIVDQGDLEECDDGNTLNGDGCDSECRVEHDCGDGTLDESGDSMEECDDGNLADGDGCNQFCELEDLCGNGAPDPTEECDDGNTTPGDGCDDLCLLESTCGDNAITGLEVCDDGNALPGDGCSATCISDETCGNSIIDPDLTTLTGANFFPADVFDEVCDDGNTSGGDDCSSDCRAAPNSLMVLVMSGVNVPICARPFYGQGSECDMEGHYHGTAYGFNDAGTAFVSAPDLLPLDCGHGKGADIHPTLKRIEVDDAAIAAYLADPATPSSACWAP